MRAWVMAAALMAPGMAWAQEQVWVQIQALPSESRAAEAAQVYAQSLEDVEGYDLGNGWWGIALGPYPRDEAVAVLRRLRVAGAIPRDAYIVSGEHFDARIWPMPGAAPEPAAPVPDVAAVEAPPVEAPADEAPQVLTPALADETAEEALASEGLLTDEQRKGLQVALQWAGVYDGAIDGAYGRGTRSAMRDWQRQKGYDGTGILTTAQRTALLADYNAILAPLGIAPVEDKRAGIAIDLPMGLVAFQEYQPPFARYDATDGSAAQVLLVSQPGDATRMAGLYEILQSLAIIPEEGPRELTDDGFTIEGRNGTIVSQTEVTLRDGAIKGFVLVWPEGDEERRQRLLGVMRSSLRPLPGTLDPGMVAPGEEQSPTLVSGLEVRQPRVTASGFWADPAGHVVTAAAAVAECQEITLDGSIPATVLVRDGDLAILAPGSAVSPRRVAALSSATPRLGAEVAAVSYPYGGALGQAALTFGTLEDVRGLDGEADVRRLSLTATPGEAGAAVIDGTGAVVGMLLPAPEGDRALPADVAYALRAERIAAALAGAGLAPDPTIPTAPATMAAMEREAAELGVLVSCW